MPHPTPNIRNLAFAGHPGAGKTTLVEALLHAGGALPSPGTVERGNTVSDFDPIERQRGHSVDAAVVALDRDGLHINLIDTPGYPDFRGPALAVLDAVETAAIVVDAGTGIGHGTRRMLDHAGKRGLCRLLVVNRIDHAEHDVGALLAALREEFGAEVLPLNLPADRGARVVDCFSGDDGDSDIGPVGDWHRRIIDQVVEVDDGAMEHYLAGGEARLSREELHDAFARALREGHLLPACFTSARTGAGVAELLDIIARLLPNPSEGNPPPFRSGTGPTTEPLRATADPDAHVLADVFRIVHDPFVGKIGVFRVFQGTVRRGAQLFVDDGRKPFRVGHLFAIHGREHVEIESAGPGDIAAIAKVEELHFDAVLHDARDETHIHLAPLALPRPMFGLAIEPASRGQEQKLATALQKLCDEDPALAIDHDTETNETVVRGLSDLHLRVLLQRVEERFGLELQTSPPKIAYRETIGAAADGHHRHKKQTGGAGQFGEVTLKVEPLPRGAGFEFVNAVKGGTIPGVFLPAVEKGVRQALERGPVAGYPVQDLRVTVLDGKHHAVDSKEVAFISAGKRATLDALARAQPQLLEPIVDVEISAPEQAVGDVSGGLAARRARISATELQGGGDVRVRAQVPLSELEGYAAELKSATAGSGRYSLDFSHYEPVPPSMQKKLADAYKPAADEG